MIFKVVARNILLPSLANCKTHHTGPRLQREPPGFAFVTRVNLLAKCSAVRYLQSPS